MIDKEKLLELIMKAQEVKEFARDMGVLDIYHMGTFADLEMQLYDEDLSTLGEVSKEPYGEYIEHSVMLDGVKIICLHEAGEKDA